MWVHGPFKAGCHIPAAMQVGRFFNWQAIFHLLIFFLGWAADFGPLLAWQVSKVMSFLWLKSTCWKYRTTGWISAFTAHIHFVWFVGSRECFLQDFFRETERRSRTEAAHTSTKLRKSMTLQIPMGWIDLHGCCPTQTLGRTWLLWYFGCAPRCQPRWSQARLQETCCDLPMAFWLFNPLSWGLVPGSCLTSIVVERLL